MDDSTKPNILRRPYGLPRWISLTSYLSEQVCTLSAFNYKLEAKIGNASEMRSVLTVLDTGAGPNLMRYDIVPADAREKINNSLDIVDLASASNHKLETVGIVHLTVQVGSYKARQPFVVTRQLGADVILGCTFIDSHIEGIFPRRKYAELANGDEVTIRRRPATEPTDHGSMGHHPSADNRVTTDDFIRLSHTVTVPPHSEMNINVTSRLQGTHILETRPELYSRKQVAIANGVATIRPNIPFTVRIANFASVPTILQKNERVGIAIPSSTEVYAINFENKESQSTEVQPSEEGGGLGSLLQNDNDVKDGVHTQVANADAKRFDVEDIELNHVPAKMRRRIRKMLKPFSSMWKGGLGTVKVTKHRIPTVEDAKPVFSQPYRAGPEARKVVKESVEDMLDKGVIEPAQSEWASPVVLVPKPDGTLRFCVDYRKLNAITVKDTYPLPRMDDCLDSLGDASIFTTLDCNSGYWQIPVAEEDRDKTTFTCHEGCFCFLRMPFGLCNAPATFQRTLDILLSGFRWKTCLVYLDDIIIFSKSAEEHLKHVEQVLSVLRTAGLSLKLSKCNFFTDTVDYLGHVIRPGLLQVATKNTEAIKGFQHPKTQTNLRSFLGMCNVYRRFVPNFARVAAPLNAFLTKGQQFNLPPFNEEQATAFEMLKEALTSPPILKLPRTDLEYSVDTDACDYQVGCSLFQTHADGVRHPIGFWSRSLTAAERNYSTGERECLAVIWAVQILRPYLERKHFDLYTDHQALKWMMNLTDVSGRLARWRLRLLEFDFTVKYRKGAANAIADAVSRLPTNNECSVAPNVDVPCFTIETIPGTEGSNCECITLSTMPSGYQDAWDDDDIDDFDPVLNSHVNSLTDAEVMAVEQSDLAPSPIRIDELIAAQQEDRYCQSVRERMDQGQSERFQEDSRGLIVRISPLDDIRQIVAPKTLRPKILHMSHYPTLAGHPGGRRMFETIRRTFYWPSMGVDVYTTARQCSSCARENVKLRKHASSMKLFPAAKPLEFLAIDLLGPLPRTPKGFRYILVITDRYSKLTRVVPLKNMTALTVAKAFCEHWVYPYGPPAYLLSDNGGQFASRYFQAVCSTLGIRNLFTTAYHPKANGQVERFNRTLLSGIRHYVAEHQRNWHEFIQPLTFAYNTHVHGTTGCTPFELVLSRPPTSLTLENVPTAESHPDTRQEKSLFLERIRHLTGKASAALQRRQARYKRDYDKRIRPLPRNLEPGHFVFVERETPRREETEGRMHRNKLQPKADGPYRVEKVDSHTVTILKDGLIDKVSWDRIYRAPVRPAAAAEQGEIEFNLTNGREQQPPTNESGSGQSATGGVSNDVEPMPLAVSNSPETGSPTLLQTPLEATDDDNINPPNVNDDDDDDQPAPRAFARYRKKDSPTVRGQSENDVQEFPVERIVNFDPLTDTFTVRWTGYGAEHDTEQTSEDLPYNLVAIYFRRLGQAVPSHLRKFLDHTVV